MLKKILHHRYPDLFSDKSVQALLDRYLTAEERTRIDLFTQFDVDESLHAIVASSVDEANGTFPCSLGIDAPSHTKQQLGLYLVSNGSSNN